MNAAQQLKNELVNKFDRARVLETIKNGIRSNGEATIYEPYRCGSGIIYGDCHIECDMSIGRAMASYLRDEGFNVRNDYHPVSGRFFGFVVTI